MIKELPEYDQFILIEGLTTDKTVEFERLMRRLKEEAPNSLIQLMDGRGIIGYDHVFFAVLNSLNARRNKRMICEDPSLEIIVYASAQRQIKSSVDMLGVKEDSRQLVLAAISKDRRELMRLKESIRKVEGLHLDDSFLSSWSQERLEKAKKMFRVSDAEFKSILLKDVPAREVMEKIVIEKMALLSLSV